MINTLFVGKTSQTFADALLVYGLALVTNDVLRRIDDTGDVTVTLRDAGPYYTLDLSPELDPERLPAVGVYLPPAPVIRTAKNAKQLPQDLPLQALVDYEAQRDRRTAYFAARQNLSKEAQVAMRAGGEHPELEFLRSLAPHPDWDVFRAINPSALAGYNKLTAQWWQIQEGLPDVLAILFSLYSTLPNDTDAAVAAWKQLDKAHGWGIGATTTSLQIYNPAQGKGQNRAKADRLAMENIKDAFWLSESLKAVGFYHAALTKQPRGSKDRKTYVLRPIEVTLGDSQAIMDGFANMMVGAQSSIQSDILADLRYTRALLQHSQDAGADDFAQLLFRRRQPARIVGGFYSAYYKNLGNSAATMNLSFIGLPGWIRVRSAEDVDVAIAILDEHERIVRQFDETHSDDIALLISYRDFISSSDLWPFFDFTAAYSGYIIRQRERAGGRARQFSDRNLGRLIMNAEPKLRRIIESEGFQNLAYAIRQSTVVAQYRKQQSDRRYDVRYGLNQELARKANYPRDFIAALSEFIHSYNAENAQVMENRQGPYRRSILTTDVEEIVALVDEFGSGLVCQLLLAYGYARTPRKDELDDD